MPETVDTLARQRIDSHEDICALRYEGINKALESLEGELKAIPRSFSSEVKLLQSTINKYVIGLMAFGIVTMMSVSAYLYVELSHKTVDRITRTEVYQKFEPKK